MVNPGRFDHRGQAIPEAIPIENIDYIWIKDPGHNAKLDWYAEFEVLMREGIDPQSLFIHTDKQELWQSIKAVHQDMLAEMRRKGSTSIIDGMGDPFTVRRSGDKILPLRGNQRLCILRAEGYKGDVPCRIQGNERDGRIDRGRPIRKD